MKKILEKTSPGLRALVLIAIAALTLANCSGRKHTIGKDGLHAIKLGENLPAPGTESLKGVPLRDTLFRDSSYTWRASVMQYKEGIVLLEQDFFGEESLNRIRIETPELKLKNGLRVGKTVADLKKINGEWYIAPLERFKVFEFYSELFPYTHFIVSAPEMDMSDPDWRNYSMEAFQEEAKIVAIVLF